VSEIDRRGFVALAGAALAATALPGCASLVATPVTPVGGRIRLALRNFPQLARPGGYVKLAPRGAATPLYVLAVDQGYAVLSPVCTHLGCLVDVEGTELVCPCHDSAFDREGRVLRGPAQRPLRRLPAALTTEGDLVVTWEDGA
jgi:cytochrome b6-f complex iron-sulfur subunit